jgi:hypothetical protein
VVDVYGDGHCGFRVVDGLRNMYVDNYHMISYQLQQDLISEENECYQWLIGLDNRYNEVLYGLIGDGICFAPPNKWMIMSDMSFLSVQRYKLVVVLMSIEKEQSETFSLYVVHRLIETK